MIKPTDLIMCVKNAQILRNTILEIIKWVSATFLSYGSFYLMKNVHTYSASKPVPSLTRTVTKVPAAGQLTS